MKRTVINQNAPKPLGPYSQAVEAGNFLFVSGQLAIDPMDFAAEASASVASNSTVSINDDFSSC